MDWHTFKGSVGTMMILQPVGLAAKCKIEYIKPRRTALEISLSYQCCNLNKCTTCGWFSLGLIEFPSSVHTLDGDPPVSWRPSTLHSVKDNPETSIGTLILNYSNGRKKSSDSWCMQVWNALMQTFNFLLKRMVHEWKTSNESIKKTADKPTLIL